MAFDAPMHISLFDGAKLIWYDMIPYGGSGEAWALWAVRRGCYSRCGSPLQLEAARIC